MERIPPPRTNHPAFPSLKYDRVNHYIMYTDYCRRGSRDNSRRDVLLLLLPGRWHTRFNILLYVRAPPPPPPPYSQTCAMRLLLKRFSPHAYY